MSRYELLTSSKEDYIGNLKLEIEKKENEMCSNKTFQYQTTIIQSL